MDVELARFEDESRDFSLRDERVGSHDDSRMYYLGVLISGLLELGLIASSRVHKVCSCNLVTACNLVC